MVDYGSEEIEQQLPKGDTSPREIKKMENPLFIHILNRNHKTASDWNDYDHERVK